ncbi:MAG: PPC domain-containing protein [Planctomycetaceae bacterium]
MKFSLSRYPCLHLSLLVSLSVGLGTAEALAEYPKIDRIFPLGAQRGVTTEVAITGKPGGTLSGWCDREGVSFAFSEKSDKVKISIAKDALPGRCLIRFYNNDGASKLLPFVIGALPEANETEPNERVRDAQVLSGDAVVNGVLSRNGDVDVYSVSLKKGQTFVATMNARRLGSPMDGVLQILDSRGVVLNQNDEGLGFDPQIVFEVPRDGVYSVRTFAFPAAPNSSIRFAGAATYAYRLTLTTGPTVDHVMPLEATAGVTKKVRAYGWNVSREANDAVAPVSEPRAVRPALDASRALDLGVVEFPSLIEESATGVLELPFVVSGRIGEEQERDVFRFKATKGSLIVNVKAKSIYSPLDPVIVVRTAAGKTVNEIDDISRSDHDIRATIKLPADGEYFIEVRDRFGHAGQRYVYAMECLKPKADFNVTISRDAFGLTGGKVEVPLTIDRRYGFAADIRFRVEGLPSGVTAKPISSKAKTDSAKTVKLVLTGRSDAVLSGPIRIVCESDQGIERLVTRTLPHGVEVADIWLRVAK